MRGGEGGWGGNIQTISILLPCLRDGEGCDIALINAVAVYFYRVHRLLFFFVFNMTLTAKIHIFL
jgi:hypothetical protein